MIQACRCHPLYELCNNALPAVGVPISHLLSLVTNVFRPCTLCYGDLPNYFPLYHPARAVFLVQPTLFAAPFLYHWIGNEYMENTILSQDFVISHLASLHPLIASYCLSLQNSLMSIPHICLARFAHSNLCPSADIRIVVGVYLELASLRWVCTRSYLEIWSGLGGNRCQ